MDLAPLGLQPRTQSTCMAGRAGRSGLRRTGPARQKAGEWWGGSPQQTRASLGKVTRSQRGPGAVTEQLVSIPHRAPGQNTVRSALGESHCVGELVSMDPNFRATFKETGSEVHTMWTRPEERNSSAPTQEPRPSGGGAAGREAGKGKDSFK